MKRSGFTLLELIFVIVVLGILAAVALPRLGSTVELSYIAKAQGDVGAIRTAIASERQKKLVQGINEYPPTLDSGGLFGAVLTYPVASSSAGGEWSGGNPNYTFSLGDGNTVSFTYDSTTGRFDCNHADANCKKIVE